MRYYNIHTHSKNIDDETTSIYCLTEEEILQRSIEDKSNLFYSCGIHPWRAEDTSLHLDDLSTLIKTNKNILAVGEVGLDKLSTSSYEKQKTIFEKQILLAEEYNLPLIIHCVKAWDDLIQLYKKHKTTVPWIIHGFRGGLEQAEQLQKLGFYFSLGMLFNKDVLSGLNIDRILLETDDSSCLIKDVYNKVTQKTMVRLVDLSLVIEQNVSFLFKIPVN